MTTTSARTAAPRAQRSGRRRVLTVVAAVLAATIAVGIAVFLGTGGRLFVVRTPSMGTTAPVGSLVITRPVDIADVKVGDVVAFHPNGGEETYTHRVVGRDGGGLLTRGDINGANDPWVVRAGDLQGRETTVLKGAGFLLRALPLLALGLLLVLGLSRWCVSRTWRGPARMLGFAALYLVTALVIRPFVGVVQLGSSTDEHGVSHIAVVSTGLLPVKLDLASDHGHADPVRLATAGDTATSLITGGTPGEAVRLQASLALTPWQWAVAIAIMLLPMLWTVVVGFRPVGRPATSHRAPTHRRLEPVPA